MNTSMVRYLLCRILQLQTAFLGLPALVGLIYREEAGLSFVWVALGCLLLGTLGSIKKTDGHFLLCKGRIYGGCVELDPAQRYRSYSHDPQRRYS